MKPQHYILLLLLPIATLLSAQENNRNITAKIQSKYLEGQMKLQASATNLGSTYQELNYLFVSIKKGSSGNLSNNKQSGKFTLKPEETKIISEINVNVEKNDALKVYLYIKDEQTQKVIAKDSLEMNSKSFENKISKVKESEIFELKGLMIDDTKTKVGKDFYDIFYMEYTKSPEKYDSAITINELPTMGRGSQIFLAVDDKTLYSFISNPSDDYLKEQALLSMKILFDYIEKNSLIQNEFRY